MNKIKSIKVKFSWDDEKIKYSINNSRPHLPFHMSSARISQVAWDSAVRLYKSFKFGQRVDVYWMRDCLQDNWYFLCDSIAYDLFHSSYRFFFFSLSLLNSPLIFSSLKFHVDIFLYKSSLREWMWSEILLDLLCFSDRSWSY